MATFQSTSASPLSSAAGSDVVEIGLLLPTSRINALIELSKKKHQSVGQILRGMIERELMDGQPGDSPDDLLEGWGRLGPEHSFR